MKNSEFVSIGQYSDRGVKDENQDSYGVLVPDEPALGYKGIVAVLADGVSGCDAGKVASESCVKSLLDDYYCTPDSWTVKKSVKKVLLATNRWMDVWAGSTRCRSSQGPGDHIERPGGEVIYGAYLPYW